MTSIFVGCAPTTTPSPARSARPVEERMAATAEQVYRSYIDASNAVDLADPSTFEVLSEFSTARFHAEEVLSLTAMHESKQIVGGKLMLESFRVRKVLPDLGVEATACLDTSQVTLTDQFGESILPDDSPVAYEMYVEFISVDGELLLDSEVGAPFAECPSTRVSSPAGEPVTETPEPELPVPGIPGTPAPQGPPREPDPSCVLYSDDLMICGG